ncbi:MAG: SUF system NifU family Fe-S cluster assembly protein [Woeseiaceae bacterium]|nr:SUF system NifU family Fe-S cluster assembly protein [Woeseiaceae bacterium]
MNQAATTGDDLRELYREVILDHARSPRHFGPLPGATHSARGVNPLCGDKLRMYLLVDDDGRIADATFEGSGCAISVASASLLTETVIGMTTGEAQAYFAALVARLSGRNTEAAAAVELGKLRALEGVKEFPSRVKCATLAWHALNSALENDDQAATTE